MRRSDPSPGSTSSLRTANQQRVLDVLRLPTDLGENATEAPTTQAHLARTTGLAPATVSTIVRDLEAAGLVEVEPGSGRRGTTIRIARSAGLVAGLDFGHSHVAVAVADVTGRILAESQHPLDAEHRYGHGLDLAETMLDELLSATGGRREELRAVGLGLPAPITDGLVRSSAILPGWVGVNAHDALAERLPCPAYVLNDANLGALAESRAGAGRGHSCVVYIKVSSGVGAGIVIGGQPFEGADGTAGEIGHLTFDDQGPVCRCGSRGCLEAYTSTGAIVALLADQFPDAGIEDVVAAARDGHPGALRTLEDAGLRLGWGLATLVNLLNPGVVVLGGDVARAGELLLAPTRVGLRRHALDAVAATPVVTSGLGSRASLVGAVMLAAESIDLALER